MMLPYYILIISILFSIPNCTSTRKTQYFESYHYKFPNPFTRHRKHNVILINTTDLIIELLPAGLFLVNHHKVYNFSNDTQFTQINLHIHDHTPHITFNQRHNQHRRLLWNHYDHSKEKHIVSGRFIGDSSQPRSFESARSMCREFYGDIATINNEKENKEFTKLCKQISGTQSKSCWIGLTQPFYEWESGQYVSWSNWMPYQPITSINEKCTRMKLSDNGKWDTFPCTNRAYAICEKPIASYHGNYVVVSKQTIKEKAASFCKSQFGSTLASIITATDAIEAHEACKKVARAPHGCWIGLSAPFRAWDNEIPLKGLKLDWKDGKEPDANNEELKCAEITNDGKWRAIPCDYERHILCNVQGVDTLQSEIDEAYLKKIKKEKKRKEVNDFEMQREENEKNKNKKQQQNDEEDENKKSKKENDKNENDKEDEDEMKHDDKKKEKDGKKTKKNAKNDPIFDQIESLKKILAEQKERLMNEQSKLKQKRDMNEDKNINHEIERLQHIDDDTFGKKEDEMSGESMKKHKKIRNDQAENVDEMQSVQDEQEKDDENENVKLHKIQSSENWGGPSIYVDKLKQGLLMHDTLKTAENAVKKSKNALSNHVGELEKAHHEQQQQQQQQKQMMFDPFGGAFGGKLSLPSNNPYAINNGYVHSFSLMPPPPPMPYERFSDMLQSMQQMNPLQLPEIPGLKGQYASRRRMMKDIEDMVDAVIKCFEERMYTVCVGYEWQKDSFFFDVYEMSMGKNNEMDLSYYFVYDFHFGFDEGNENDEQCQNYNEMDVICVKIDDESVVLQIEDRNGQKHMFDYDKDDMWNEIYDGERKCVDLESSKICMIEEDANTYLVEMKFEMVNE